MIYLDEKKPTDAARRGARSAFNVLMERIFDDGHDVTCAAADATPASPSASVPPEPTSWNVPNCGRGHCLRQTAALLTALAAAVFTCMMFYLWPAAGTFVGVAVGTAAGMGLEELFWQYHHGATLPDKSSAALPV